jgi:glutamate-ammonia-ligase adenylyltransferase
MVRKLLQSVGPHPALEIDADLRPEGKNGPLARSLESTREYYHRWSDPWEAQALLRARPCAGDEDLQQAYLDTIDDVRYPVTLDASALTQVRRLKARMESERLPRGTDPRRHVKLGPGGLSDVEWTVQLIQLRSAASHTALKTPHTLDALGEAVRANLLSTSDAEILDSAWRLATRIRGALALRGAGKGADVLPHDATELKVLADIMRMPLAGTELDDEYQRTARRARKVTERVFYGWTDGK